MIDPVTFQIARDAWQRGENIVEALAATPRILSPVEIVRIAYDLQAGTYIEALDQPETAGLKKESGRELANVFKKYGITSVCDAGTGECTSLLPIIEPILNDEHIYAFDGSLSRLLHGRRYLQAHHRSPTFFVSDLDQIALLDGSVDAVLSIHALEPNRGAENVILAEYCRVAARFIILLEPDYETFGDEQRRRMDHHGYVKNIRGVLSKLPVRTVEDRPWDYNGNPLNKASLLIVEKKFPVKCKPGFAHPSTKQALTPRNGVLTASEAGVVFPIIDGIPILNSESAILCSHQALIGGAEPSVIRI